MRLRPPRSAQTRARFRLLIFCALGVFALVCATVVFVTTRSSLPGSANADAIAGFVGISVLVYSGMLIYLFASDYRPHRTLQVVVATLFSAGASVSLYLAGVRTLHLSPPARYSTSACLIDEANDVVIVLSPQAIADDRAMKALIAQERDVFQPDVDQILATRQVQLARVRPVEVPVPGDGAHPLVGVLAGVARGDREQADSALAAFVVAVEQLDGELAPLLDGGDHAPVEDVVAIPHGPLPEADAAGGNVQIPTLAPELVEVRVGLSRAVLRRRVPCLQDRDARADVAQRHGQVDAAVDELDGGLAAAELRPVVVGPHDLVRGVLEPGGHQHRAEPCQQRPLGGARRAVGRAHRGERAHGQHQRGARRGQRRDGRPVGHATEPTGARRPRRPPRPRGRPR